jgi:hypothetical protein
MSRASVDVVRWNSSKELHMCKLYLLGVQEVERDLIGFGDIEPADESTASYGYGMPMMNMKLRKFHCERREKICIQIDS